MAIRPPRSSFSVARHLSERARAAAAPEREAGPTGLAALGGMVDALRGLIETLAEAGHQPGPATSDTEADRKPAHGFSIGGGGTQMVFGYTLRMGEDGIAAERFGDVPDPGPAKPAAPPPRQPIAELFEEDDEIVVVAELPGADPARISCKVVGGALLIEAVGQRRYRKSLPLPAPVSAEGLRSSFQNGILEVRLHRERRP
jgi:HSP20 family protein